jgi:sugar phosphate isomerase/epimerase
MINFSFSTASFATGGLGETLDAIAEAGFASIELFGAGASFAEWQTYPGDKPPSPPTVRAAADFRRQIEKRGLRADTVHAPLRKMVLGAPSEEWRKENVVALGGYLRFAGEIGAQGVVIHGIPNPMFLPPDRPLPELIEPMVRAMKRSVEELIPVAAEARVRMLLENLPYQRGLNVEYPLIRMSQLRPFVEEFPPDQVGLVVDTGHSWTNGDEPVADIRIAGDRLWGTHLQDVPRANPTDNHWMPTRGELDWPGICAELRRIGYRGAWTFEAGVREGENAADLARRSRAVAESWERA